MCKHQKSASRVTRADIRQTPLGEQRPLLLRRSAPWRLRASAQARFGGLLVLAHQCASTLTRCPLALARQRASACCTGVQTPPPPFGGGSCGASNRVLAVTDSYTTTTHGARAEGCLYTRSPSTTQRGEMCRSPRTAPGGRCVPNDAIFDLCSQNSECGFEQI